MGKKTYSNIESARVLVSDNTYYSVQTTDVVEDGKTTRLFGVRKFIKTASGQLVPTRDGFAVPLEVARAIGPAFVKMVSA